MEKITPKIYPSIIDKASSNMALISWLPFLLLLIPLLVLLRNKQKNSKERPPPSLPKLPLVGNLHQLLGGTLLDHVSLWKLSKKYGPVMQIQLGRVPAVIFSSAEGAKEILKTNDACCCTRATNAGSSRLTYNFLDVAFAPYGDYWKEMRKIYVSELFSVKRVQSYQSLREIEVAKLVTSLSDSSGAPVDLNDMFFGHVADTIFRIGFGTSLERTKYKTGGDILRLLEDMELMVGGRTIGEYFPSCIGWIIDRINGVPKRYDGIFNEVDGFFQQLVDDHLKPGRKQEHEDIIDLMLRIAKETGVGGTQLGQDSIKSVLLGQDSIKAVLVDIILGGIDATAVTMVSVMGELARHPKMMKKVQEEVRNCVGNKGKVIENDTEELHYLKLIIKETLRLHPPVPLMLPHETMSPVKILGYDIKPKTQYHVNVWAVARDPEFWKDPEEFIPERFDGSSVDFKGQHFGFLPFGSGRRMCPGLYMGITSVEIVLANLLYWFDWKLPDGMKVEDVAVVKRAPLNLVPVKFSQNGRT